MPPVTAKPTMDGELAASAPVATDRLLETIHAQQSQIFSLLATLDTRSRDFDALVGDAVQRAFTEAVGMRATTSLSQLHRATSVRFARWAFGVVSACALVPAVLSWLLLPSQARIMQSRDTVEQLSATVAQLSREGGRIQLEHCGATQRLCARVDRKSPFYGEAADFMILEGY